MVIGEKEFIPSAELTKMTEWVVTGISRGGARGGDVNYSKKLIGDYDKCEQLRRLNKIGHQGASGYRSIGE